MGVPSDLLEGRFR